METEQIPVKMPLTRRGYSLAELIHEGLLNEQIAEKLRCSLGTIKVQLSTMLYARIPHIDGSRRVHVALMFERGQFVIKDAVLPAAVRRKKLAEREKRWNAIFDKKVRARGRGVLC